LKRNLTKKISVQPSTYQIRFTTSKIIFWRLKFVNYADHNEIRTVLGKSGAAIDGQQYLPVVRSKHQQKNNRKTEEKTIDTFNFVLIVQRLLSKWKYSPTKKN
jgi:hypothetical protein